MIDSVFAHMAALILGSFIAAWIREGAAGNERFSLPFGGTLVVTLVGTVLSFWFGWASTLTILGLYTAYGILGGLMERFSDEVDEALGPPPGADPVPVDPVRDGFEREGPSPEAKRARALETGEITDIVFRTELSLMEIAEALGLEDASIDGENHWEWVIGTLGRTDLDVTRTHRKPSGEVDTRIFLVGNGVFSVELKRQVVERLWSVVAGPIRCGQSIYLRGNDFDFVTLEEYFAAPDAHPQYSAVRVIAVPDADRVISGEPPAVGDEGTIVELRLVAGGVGYTVEERGDPPGHNPRWIADFDHDQIDLVSGAGGDPR